MTLAEFLLARIAEDEELARDAALTVGWDGFGEQRIRSGQSWNPSHHVVKRVRDDGPTDRREVADCGALFGISTAAHIARHDPARVLAECGAKRRIVERESGAYTMCSDLPPELTPIETEWRSNREVVHVAFGDGTWETMSDATFRERFMRPTESEVLRLLALPYAGHPDYDESWRA